MNALINVTHVNDVASVFAAAVPMEMVAAPPTSTTGLASAKAVVFIGNKYGMDSASTKIEKYTLNETLEELVDLLGCPVVNIDGGAAIILIPEMMTAPMRSDGNATTDQAIVTLRDFRGTDSASMRTVTYTLDETLQEVVDALNAAPGSGGSAFSPGAAVTAINGLTPAVSRFVMYTGASTAAMQPISDGMLQLVGSTPTPASLISWQDADNHIYLPHEAWLASFINQAVIADRMLYFTGASTAALTALTAFGRAVMQAGSLEAVRLSAGIKTVFGTFTAGTTGAIDISGSGITAANQIIVSVTARNASTALGAFYTYTIKVAVGDDHLPRCRQTCCQA